MGWKKKDQTKIPLPRETSILKAVLDAVAFRRDVDAWRNNSGAAMLKGRGGKPQHVRFGVKGQADISGTLTVAGLGIRLEVEVKRPGGKQSEDQKRFQERIEKSGGVYLLVDSATDFMRQADDASLQIAEKMRKCIGVSV